MVRAIDASDVDGEILGQGLLDTHGEVPHVGDLEIGVDGELVDVASLGEQQLVLAAVPLVERDVTRAAAEPAVEERCHLVIILAVVCLQDRRLIVGEVDRDAEPRRDAELGFVDGAGGIELASDRVELLLRSTDLLPPVAHPDAPVDADPR